MNTNYRTTNDHTFFKDDVIFSEPTDSIFELEDVIINPEVEKLFHTYYGMDIRPNLFAAIYKKVENAVDYSAPYESMSLQDICGSPLWQLLTVEERDLAETYIHFMGVYRIAPIYNEISHVSSTRTFSLIQ